MPNARRALVAVAALLAAGAALADESQIELKPGDGMDAVEANCATCHSLDYIPMNSPFLDQKGWEGEVNKMVKVFGAPVSEPDHAAIVAYLVANYAKE
jgi:mono/diheme cytochrome c family protein